MMMALFLFFLNLLDFILSPVFFLWIEQYFGY